MRPVSDRLRRLLDDTLASVTACTATQRYTREDVLGDFQAALRGVPGVREYEVRFCRDWPGHELCVRLLDGLPLSYQLRIEEADTVEDLRTWCLTVLTDVRQACKHYDEHHAMVAAEKKEKF